MSFQLSTIGLSLPSPIHNRKPINHFAVSCSTNFSVCNVWGSKYAAAAKKKDDVENTRLSSLQLDSRRQALKRVVTNCSQLSIEEDVSLDRGSKEDDTRIKFREVYSVLKSEILNDPSFDWTPDSRLWVDQMLDYNVPKGKLVRGLYVMNCYKVLKEGEELSEDEVFEASVVAWCIKWIEAGGIILDDIIDSSETRRNQLCWHSVPKVGNIAINDAVLLFSHVPRILKKHLEEKPYYVDLLNLFNELLYFSFSGQMLDMLTLVGERNLSNYTLPLYRRLAQYKTGYLNNLPVACALLMAGENLENHVYTKDLLIEMGIHFQIVNDYLDCFGNPEKTGKIGTDIESFKCSWLVVKTLELANEKQKEILHEHYGKADPSDVAKVKAVYNEINLQGVFAAYETESYDKLRDRVEAQYPSKLMQGVFASFGRYLQLLKIQYV